MSDQRRSVRRTIAASSATALAVGTLMLAVAGPAAAQTGDEPSCSVPPLLRQAAAVVDPDSLEGCDFFEDPNYHDNRREAGVYNPNGPFSLLFRR